MTEEPTRAGDAYHERTLRDLESATAGWARPRVEHLCEPERQRRAERAILTDLSG